MSTDPHVHTVGAGQERSASITLMGEAPPAARPVDQLTGLRGHVDGLAPQIAEGAREGAEAIRQGRPLVDQHEMRTPHDTEPAAHRRRRLEGLRPDLDAEPLRGLDQLVEEMLGIHQGDGTRRARAGEGLA